MGLSDQACVELLRWACPRLGLRFEGLRSVRGQVCKRVGRRMAALGLTTPAEYRARLESSPEEWTELDAACRVTISRFYRDRAVFDALRQLLPPLGRRAVAEGRALRCWSAGSCSGEEPYTLSLVLQLGLLPPVPELTFEILATDADPFLLERARVACYQAGTLRDLPEAWREQAFREEPAGWCLLPRFRAKVVLARQDLRHELPDGPFDLLLCRNVAFTYFEPAAQDALLRALVQRLLPGGLLVIGTRERLPSGGGLVREGTHLPVFRRAGAD